MELMGLVWVPAWLIAVVGILVSWVVYTVWTHRTFEKMGIPGPRPGIFGVLGTMAKKGLVQHDMDLVKTYGKVVGTYHGRQPLLVVADPELVKAICVKEFSNFTNRFQPVPVTKEFRYAITVAEDDHWKFVRSVLSPSFSSGKMRDMVGLIQKAESTLVFNIQKTMQEKDKVEVKQVFGAFTMDVIASTGFGLDIDSQNNPNDPFVKNAKDAFHIGPRAMIIFTLCSVIPKMKEIMEFFNVGLTSVSLLRFFSNVVNTLMQDRVKENASKRRDLLQLMLNAHLETSGTHDKDDLDTEMQHKHNLNRDKALNHDEVVSNAIIFLLAAYETTAATLTFVSYLLANHPDCQERLRKEIEGSLGKNKPTYDNVWKLQYLDNVVNETLRVYPPAARSSRMCGSSIEVDGIPFYPGLDVHFAIYPIHHDPDYWPEPEKFDPDRFLPENKAGRHPYAFIPFGAGPRNCVGMRLALLEVKMTVVSLLQNFRIVPCKETEIPLKLAKGGLLKAENDVYLRFESLA